MIRKITNYGIHVKGVIKGGKDYFGIIHHIYKLEYLGSGKKILVFYCRWFNPTLNSGPRIHLQYNIAEIKINGKYIPYDPFTFHRKLDRFTMSLTLQYVKTYVVGA